MALSIFVERLLDDYILSPITANSVILNDLGAHAFAVILLLACAFRLTMSGNN